ncbi:MAG: terminase small subunit [Firmicutes bacterium]|nr:terminase small subunit [Bacillota bacterium]
MTEKQKKFCDEYIISCNATQAAINAGYTEDSARVTGAKLLTKANIRAYIDEQLKRMHDKKIADGEEVLSYLTAVMRGEHTEQVLQLVGDGVQRISDIDVSAKERLKAAELIGKRYGLFTDKVELGGAAKVIFEDDLKADDPDE